MSKKDEVEAMDDTQTSIVDGLSEKEVYEQLCAQCNEIAQPLASRKLTKKLYKLVKKASKEKGYLRQGVAEVQRAIRKGEKGITILAGNVTPIDVYCHIPGVCEEKELPYVYTPSKEQLGLAAGHKRPSIMMFVRPCEGYQEMYDEVKDVIDKLPLSV